MPPILASALFVLFIGWLFLRDTKSFGKMPVTLWIPFFWVGINCSRSVLYWFASGTEASAAGDVTDGNAIDRNIYTVLICAGIVVLLQRRLDWSRIFASCRWLLILYAYYLVSITWSVEPFVAFKRWVKDAGDLVMILIILSDPRPADALRFVFVRCAYVLVPLSVLFIKWYPALGRYIHRYTYQTYYCGITTNKNSLGLLCMLTVLFLLWHLLDFHRKRTGKLRVKEIWPELTIGGMALWLLHLANSSTALACLIIGSSLIYLTRRSWVKRNLTSVGWAAFAFGLVMVVFTVSSGFRGLIAGALGRDVTLTDRTLIWEMVLDSGTNPIVGSGFASYLLSKNAVAAWEEFHISEAHNGYIEVYLNAGWIGVALLFAMLLSAGKNVLVHFQTESVFGYLLMSLYWSALIYNYTESTFSRTNAIGMLLSLMAMCGISLNGSSKNAPEPWGAATPTRDAGPAEPEIREIVKNRVNQV